MDRGYYLYAIGSESEPRLRAVMSQGASDKIPGIDPEHSVESVIFDSLQACASQVNLDEFGQEQIKRNLQDIAWLESKARAHDAIVRRLSECGTIVPVRFGTV